MSMIFVLYPWKIKKKKRDEYLRQGFNQFVPNTTILYHLKTLENLTIF